MRLNAPMTPLGQAVGVKGGPSWFQRLQEKDEETATLKTLEKKWGPDTKLNIGKAKGVLTTHADKPFMAEVEKSGVARTPEMVKGLFDISNEVRPGQVQGDVQARIRLLMSDVLKGYNKRRLL